MRFFGKFALLGFDDKSWTEDVRFLAYDTVIEAALQFLQAAAPSVPVDTGMARGSFLNLVQYLRSKGREPGVDIPDVPQRLLKSGRPLKYVHTDNRVFPKTPESATELSTKPTSIIKNVGDKFTFTYESRVRHLNLNENKWQSFARGRDAFQQFAYFQKLNPIDYIVSTSYSLGSQPPPGAERFLVRKQKTVRNR